jgi:hypothetical protein
MAAGRKRNTGDVPISAFLIDPLPGPERVRRATSRSATTSCAPPTCARAMPIFENVDGVGLGHLGLARSVRHQRDILERLRTGSIDLEFRMAPNQPDCNRADRPLIIENSFITLQVAQVDGVVQTIGLDNGYASVDADGAAQGTWSLEMWVYLEAVRRDARVVADSALVMLYENGAMIDLVNKKPDFAIFLLGDTNRGVQVKYPGSTATVNGYDIVEEARRLVPRGARGAQPAARSARPSSTSTASRSACAGRRRAGRRGAELGRRDAHAARRLQVRGPLQRRDPVEHGDRPEAHDAHGQGLQERRRWCSA